MATKDISDYQVVNAYASVNRAKGIYPDEILRKETNESLKVVCAAMARAAGRGYIQYGVSLRTGWLTPKGREFLAFIAK